MIRVGRIKYNGGAKQRPSYPGFKVIEVMTASTAYGSLSPFILQDDQGYIVENIWQGSKVYKNVPKTHCTYSRWDKTVIWEHPAEKHVDKDGKLLDAYWAWREKLVKNPYPVRYPAGYANRHNCLYALWEGEKLGYIEARVAIYLPLYCELARKERQFAILQRMLECGDNLLIVEVDGPHQESLEYYKENWDVADDFIEQDTILVTEENMTIMLNDERHPFGHGYCLAMALLDME